MNAVRAADTATSSDHELLKRFIDAGDGVAFACLVERHGPLVFREAFVEPAFVSQAPRQPMMAGGIVRIKLHGPAQEAQCFLGLVLELA